MAPEGKLGMDAKVLKNILEGAMLAAGKPLTLDNFVSLFDEKERPEKDEIKQALKELEQDLHDRGIELKRVASGYRLQVKNAYSPWVSRLWEEKPPRYSRAFLETLALIAYRQPISRGEIEAVRGVAVSSSIIRTMLEREWIKVVGHRDVPGKPAMYGTTKAFLDSFNLKSLEELPSLMEVRSLTEVSKDAGVELPAELSPQQEINLQDEQTAEAESETEQVATADVANPEQTETEPTETAQSETLENSDADAAAGDVVNISTEVQATAAEESANEDAEQPATEKKEPIADELTDDNKVVAMSSRPMLENS